MITRFRSWIDPYLLLLWALCLPVLAPLLAPGYFFAAHDGRHSVFYQVLFDASFRSGAWWPRWAMHHSHGYGYPTFIIQAPLGSYLAELFVLLGAGFTTAVKFAWAIGLLIGAWGMYRLIIHWLSEGREADSSVARSDTLGSLDPVRIAALVAGLLYAYLPYRLLDMYVRAAFNDTLLLACFPWVFLAFDRLISQGGAPGWTRRLAGAILALAATLLTHSFALISFTPLLITFVLFRLGLWAWRRPAAIWRGLTVRTLLAVAGGIGALLLCATFILPLLVETQYLQEQVFVGNTYNFRNHFIFLGQFLSPFWGAGYSDDPTGANDGMGFQLGALLVIIAIASLYTLTRRPAQRGVMLYLLLATVAVLFIMTSASAPLWETITVLAVIQFPWRLLALAGFLLAALAGLTVWNLLPAGDRARREAAGGLLMFGLLAVYASFPYLDVALQPVEPWREDGRAIFQFESEHPDMFGYTTWMQERFVDSPMSDEYAAADYQEDHGFNTTLERLSLIGGQGEVLSNHSFGSRFGGVVRMETPGVVRINLAYFPGWRVTIDGAPVVHRVSPPRGLIEVDVPAGEHRVDVVMGSTPVRHIGTITSWVMVAIVLALLLWPVKRTTDAAA